METGVPPMATYLMKIVQSGIKRAAVKTKIKKRHRGEKDLKIRALLQK
jgi:hypothetical protein